MRGGMHGAGRGLVGFFVKPVVGFSDAATDVFNTVQSATRPSADYSSLHRSNSGVSSSGGGGGNGNTGSASSNSSSGADLAVTNSSSVQQARPPRAFYGAARVIRPYQPEDALAIMLLRTVIADHRSPQHRKNADSQAAHDEDEEEYLDHLDLGAFVLLLSTRRLVVVDDGGCTHLSLWLKDLACCERRSDGVALHLFDPVDVTSTTTTAACFKAHAYVNEIVVNSVSEAARKRMQPFRRLLVVRSRVVVQAFGWGQDKAHGFAIRRWSGCSCCCCC